MSYYLDITYHSQMITTLTIVIVFMYLGTDTGGYGLWYSSTDLKPSMELPIANMPSPTGHVVDNHIMKHPLKHGLINHNFRMASNGIATSIL